MKAIPAAAMAMMMAFLSSCADTRHHMVVSVADQRMLLLDQGRPIAQFPVSTSKFALGDIPGTKATPLGRLAVAKKVGGGQPLGMKFKSRKPTGEIVPVNAPGRDPIVTRILWLKGLEEQNKNTYSRYIYIHGTPEENKLGTPASFGCVRMRSVDVAWLYETVGRGARVNITEAPLAEAVPQLAGPAAAAALSDPAFAGNTVPGSTIPPTAAPPRSAASTPTAPLSSAPASPASS